MPPSQSSHNGASRPVTDTEFMPQRANLVTGLVKQFRRERTGTHTRTIGLENTIYLTNLVGSNTQTGTSTRTNGIGRSDKRIRTEINIKHRPLRTFAQAQTCRLPDRLFISCSLSTNWNCFKYSIPSNHAFSISASSYS